MILATNYVNSTRLTEWIGNLACMRTVVASTLIALLSILIACSQKIAQEQNRSALQCHANYSAVELNEDFNYLWSNLSAKHPNLYRVHSEKIIAERVSSIQGQLKDSLSYLQFLKLVAPLLTDIGCINTQWGHSRDYIEFRNANIPLFPLRFKIVGDRFLIDENYSSDQSLVQGDEILAINGIRAIDYLEQNYPLLPTDGEIKTIQKRWLESYFPNHHSNFWEQIDTFKLLIKEKNKQEKEVKIEALLKDKINKRKENKIPLSLALKDSLAVLKVATFNDNVLKRNGLNFTQFLDSAFAIIDSAKVNELILDVRGNAWGNIDHGAALLSYLSQQDFQYVEAIHSKVDLNPIIRKEFTKIWPAQELSYSNKLYVLADGWNVNAGGYFCTKIKNRPLTFMGGEVAGNTAFGMNAMSQDIVLPHSGIHVYIPTAAFVANPNEMKNISGIPLVFQVEAPIIENTIRYIQQK